VTVCCRLVDAEEKKGRIRSAGERWLTSESEVFVEANNDAFDFEKVLPKLDSTSAKN
jgi:hypothetical protein